MIRYILTHPKFKGEVVVSFDENNELIVIDFQPAELGEVQKKYLLENMPVLYSDLWLKSLKDKKFVCVAEPYELDFDMFWDKYAKKVNRIRSESVWKRLSKPEQVRAFAGIKAYDRHLFENSWKGKADPDTYLREKYWTNEY